MAEDEDANIISRMEKSKATSKKEVPGTKTDYTKYAVGGESKEVPASTESDENPIFKKRTQQSKNDNVDKV
jgi:hypothetical protein